MKYKEGDRVLYLNKHNNTINGSYRVLEVFNVTNLGTFLTIETNPVKSPLLAQLSVNIEFVVLDTPLTRILYGKI